MADAQVLSSAVSFGSADYKLDTDVTFVLKAVNAEFDGSGATAAWLPAVIITSDSGHTVARAVDQSVSVAAGGSAEASFFPGVKHAAGGAAAAGAGAWGHWRGTLTLNAGATQSGKANLALIATSDSARYTASGGDGSINEGGAYLIFCGVGLSSTTMAASDPIRLEPDFTVGGASSSSDFVLQFQSELGIIDLNPLSSGHTWDAHVVELYNLADADVPLLVNFRADCRTGPPNNVGGTAYITAMRMSDPVSTIF